MTDIKHSKCADSVQTTKYPRMRTALNECPVHGCRYPDGDTRDQLMILVRKINRIGQDVASSSMAVGTSLQRADLACPIPARSRSSRSRRTIRCVAHRHQAALRCMIGCCSCRLMKEPQPSQRICLCSRLSSENLGRFRHNVLLCLLSHFAQSVCAPVHSPTTIHLLVLASLGPRSQACETCSVGERPTSSGLKI